MIVNKEQVDCVITDPATGEKYESKELIVSYVDKDSTIKYLRYPIPREQMFTWQYSNRQYADQVWKSFDNKFVKRVRAEQLNEHRMNELLCGFGAAADPLFQSVAPDTWFCDIETNVEDEFPEADTTLQPVNTIALTKFPRTIVWSRKNLTEKEKEYVQNKIDTHPDVYVRQYKFEFRYFETEAEMLLDFFKFIQPIPAVTGWNFLGYDWMYLYNRAVKVLGMDISWLSPTGHFYNFAISNKLGKRNVMLPYHKVIYDYLMVYQKWDGTVKVKENNTLDFVAGVVLGYKKIQHKLGFKDFYEKEFPDYVFYNLIDTILVEQIDKKIHTSNIWYALTAGVRSELNFSFSTVKPTEVALVNFAYRENKVVPGKKKVEGDQESYEGAFVWPTQPGIYKFIGGLDFASLYPTTQRQFNISPETFLFKDTTGTYVPKANEIKTKSGSVFTKDFQGMIPKILTYYFNARKESKAKRKQVDVEYEALKHILEERKAKIAQAA